MHLDRDVLGFPVVDQSDDHARLNLGPVELVLTRCEKPSGRFEPGPQLVVEIDRRDGEFAEELASARRVAIGSTFDADDREYTDVRGPDGEYVLISQPDRRSWADRHRTPDS